MTVEGLQWSILGPAFLAGLLVLSTHVPLGSEVLKRGIIFIDLAIAQVAGLGVIAAHGLGAEAHGFPAQAAALAAALAAGASLHWTERRWPEFQEPLIGTLFVLAASGSVLLLANDPRAGEHLQELLVGELLWVRPAQLAPVALLYAGVLGIWFGLRARLGPLLFYGLFAVSVTASVQLVGLYLVFASLIIPALASRAHPPAQQLRVAYAVGGGGYALGLPLSALLDLPAGAVIVWSLAALGLATVAFGVRKGSLDSS